MSGDAWMSVCVSVCHRDDGEKGGGVRLGISRLKKNKRGTLKEDFLLLL